MARRRHVPADPALAASLVGLTEQAARERLADLGLVVRLVDWDRVVGGVMLTMEFRDDRVTVQVRGGVVVEAQVG